MYEDLITEQAKLNLIELIKECKKFKPKAETNSQNTLVIGYDHVIKPDQHQKLQQITEEEAIKLLRGDLKSTFDEAERYWGVVLKYMGDWRMAAILDATYSCGMLRWARLTQAIFEQNWPLAAEELLDSRYAHQVGDRAKRNSQIIRTDKQKKISEFKKL